MKHWLLVSATLVCTLSNVRADEVERQFLATYRVNEPTLYKKYVENRKVRLAYRAFCSFTSGNHKVGDPLQNGEIELISDGTQYMVKSLRHENVGVESSTANVANSTDAIGQVRSYWTPELSFYVSRDARGNYEVKHLAFVSGSLRTHEAHSASGFHTLPLRLGGGDLRTSFALDPPPQVILPPRRGASVKKVTWRGKEVTELSMIVDESPPVRCSYYFDHNNSYASCGMETEVHSTNEVPDPHKVVAVIEYQPSVDGYPVPKSYRKTYQFQNGTSKSLDEWDYLSWEHYKPDPEEFRLEKEFGLATPFPSMSPEGPVGGRNRAWPWWLLLGGLVLGTIVAVIFFVRRRRSARQSPTSSARPVA